MNILQMKGKVLGVVSAVSLVVAAVAGNASSPASSDVVKISQDFSYTFIGKTINSADELTENIKSMVVENLML